jgi:hypothetical protein
MDFSFLGKLNLVDKISVMSGITGMSQILLQLQIAIMKSFGLVGEAPAKPDSDPFIKYYFAVCCWIVLFLWIALKYTPSDVKLIAVLIEFILLPVLAIVAVLWRKILIKNYTEDPRNYPQPPGFLHGPHNSWPYFLLIPFTVVTMFFLIMKYGSITETEKSLATILIAYGCVLISLISIRLWWQQVDSKGLKKFRDSHQEIANEYRHKLDEYRRVIKGQQ